MAMIYHKNNYGATNGIKLQGHDDGPMILLVAMFESLCQDLATMRRMGMWKNNPKEAIGHQLQDVLLHTEGPITPRLVLKEYLSNGIKHLGLLIDTASAGKVKIGQSCAIRWAKELSEQAPNYARVRI